MSAAILFFLNLPSFASSLNRVNFDHRASDSPVIYKGRFTDTEDLSHKYRGVGLLTAPNPMNPKASSLGTVTLFGGCGVTALHNIIGPLSPASGSVLNTKWSHRVGIGANPGTGKFNGAFTKFAITEKAAKMRAEFRVKNNGKEPPEGYYGGDDLAVFRLDGPLIPKYYSFKTDSLASKQIEGLDPDRQVGGCHGLSGGAARPESVRVVVQGP